MRIIASAANRIRSGLAWSYQVGGRRIISRLGLHGPAKFIYNRLNFETEELVTLEMADRTAEFEIHRVGERKGVKRHQKEEEEVVRDVIDQLEPNDIFYDIGGWIGTWTSIVGQENITVHTFEPIRQRTRRIEENARRNGVSASVHNVGLSTSEEELRIGPDEDGFTLHDGAEELQLVNGDEYIRSSKIEGPDVVKIDVDGHELDTIRGLSKTLQKARLVYCEVHPELLSCDPAKVEGELAELGFEVEQIHDRGNVYFVRAER